MFKIWCVCELEGLERNRVRENEEESWKPGKEFELCEQETIQQVFYRIYCIRPSYNPRQVMLIPDSLLLFL